MYCNICGARETAMYFLKYLALLQCFISILKIQAIEKAPLLLHDMNFRQSKKFNVIPYKSHLIWITLYNTQAG